MTGKLPRLLLRGVVAGAVFGVVATRGSGLATFVNARFAALATAESTTVAATLFAARATVASAVAATATAISAAVAAIAATAAVFAPLVATALHARRGRGAHAFATLLHGGAT